VITHEDILRSGVTSVPEALRLAPNLLITQTSSSAYTISARASAVIRRRKISPTAAHFDRRRSVYTPLFSESTPTRSM